MPIYPEFKGRVAVVTGAAQGIGAVTAIAFAKQGAKVALLDIDGAGAKKVADGIAAGGGRAVAIHVDVTEELSVARAIDSVATELGGFDILVNCAGGYGRLATIEDMPIEEWDRTIALNLRSVFLVSKAAIPHLKRSKAGRIINVSS
ncbi:MAG TPA: SDR family NAD(P)-dependent oxidoreductase, partial [Rhizomicrobium sp.]|nr:SDR family NAD(P)-dependent oxidoreductase [Rhizomicrobium sp.]